MRYLTIVQLLLLSAITLTWSIKTTKATTSRLLLEEELLELAEDELISTNAVDTEKKGGKDDGSEKIKAKIKDVILTFLGTNLHFSKKKFQKMVGKHIEDYLELKYGNGGSGSSILLLDKVKSKLKVRSIVVDKDVTIATFPDDGSDEQDVLFALDLDTGVDDSGSGNGEDEEEDYIFTQPSGTDSVSIMFDVGIKYKQLLPNQLQRQRQRRAVTEAMVPPTPEDLVIEALSGLGASILLQMLIVSNRSSS